MSPFRAGVLALVLIATFAYFGFTKANPFANPYEFHAVFTNVNNLKPKLAGAHRRRGGGQGQEGRGRGVRQRRRPGDDGDRGARPADPRGRRAEDPPPHLPRGQLLRGPRARLPVRRRSWPRATRSRSPRPPRRSSSATCSPRCRRTPARTSRPSCASTPRACRTAAPRASTRPWSTGSPHTATRRSPTTPPSASTPTATCSACSTASSRPSPRSTRTSAR